MSRVVLITIVLALGLAGGTWMIIPGESGDQSPRAFGQIHDPQQTDRHSVKAQGQSDRPGQLQPEPKPADAKKAVGDDEPALVIEIEATLDNQRVAPNRKVRITEVIPAARAGSVVMIGHTVHLLARYDETKGAFVPFARSEDVWRDPTMDFEDLPQRLMGFGDRDLPFSVWNPRQKGFEFEFTPRYVGIFEIQAWWSLRGEPQRFASQPLILVVAPPIGEDGRPAMRAEWRVPK